MPQVTKLVPVADGLGVVLDVPMDGEGCVLIYTQDEIDGLLSAEREACAKLVEDEGKCRHVDHVQGFCACQGKADAIRARK